MFDRPVHVAPPEIQKWVCPPGIGDMAIQLTAITIRRLHELPADVEIIRALPPYERPPDGGLDYEWRKQMAWEAPRAMFLHVRHRYCTRLTPGMLMEIIGLDEFIERYHTMKASEQGP